MWTRTATLMIAVAIAAPCSSAYQEHSGVPRFIPARFAVRGREVQLRIGAYDLSERLVIDPVLSLAVPLGGTGFDAGYAVATDSAGDMYITGTTGSAAFNGPAGVRPNSDLFVAKVRTDGTVVYTTILGGNGNDAGKAIAVDQLGRAVVAGVSGGGFPVTPDALQSKFGGLQDAVVLRLDPEGRLLYATYLGAGGTDVGTGIGVDDHNAVYVSGYTSSYSFPVTPGAPQTSFRGGYDAFLAKLDPSGTSLIYSTLLGGSGTDLALALAVSTAGRACISGFTDSADLPLSHPIQAVLRRQGDALVACLNPLGSWDYVTYLGGDGRDRANAVAIGDNDATYVGGETLSDDFPFTSAAFQRARAGDYDGFVVKIDSRGLLVYATLFGGRDSDSVTAVSVDSRDRVLGVLQTRSPDLPVQGTPVSAYRGGLDAALFMLSAAGDRLLACEYIGGSGDDALTAAASAGFGSVVMSGFTSSLDFPVTGPGEIRGAYDAILVRVATPVPVVVFRGIDNAIWALAQDWTTPVSAGGVLAGEPGAAQGPSGDIFVAARDPYGRLWLNTFSITRRGWLGWVTAGGGICGRPGLAVSSDNTAWISVRDPNGGYWLISYRVDRGFGAWTPLGGGFSSDPALAIAADGSVYVVGAARVPYQAQLYSGRYVIGSGFQNWALGAVSAASPPSAVAGADGAVYVAMRGATGAVWMSRLTRNNWGAWYMTAGVLAGQPQLAADAGKIYVAALDPLGRVWTNLFTETTANGWGPWTFLVQPLLECSIAATGGSSFVAGRDENGDLWWYESASGWRSFGNRGTAAGPLVATPR